MSVKTLLLCGSALLGSHVSRQKRGHACARVQKKYLEVTLGCAVVPPLVLQSGWQVTLQGRLGMRAADLAPSGMLPRSATGQILPVDSMRLFPSRYGSGVGSSWPALQACRARIIISFSPSYSLAAPPARVLADSCIWKTIVQQKFHCTGRRRVQLRLSWGVCGWRVP